MKSILISVKPKWAELEMNGKKLIEVRKNYIEPPFKVFNYVTKSGNDSLVFSTDYEDVAWNKPYIDKEHNRVWTMLHGNYLKKLCKDKMLNGKVAFEYVVNKVDTIINNCNGFCIKGEDIAYTNRIANQSCLQFPDLRDYLKDKDGYGWHISDLKIYDKPKELTQFKKRCNRKNVYGIEVSGCSVCRMWRMNYKTFMNECVLDEKVKVEKSPRNYIYVSDLSEVEK